MYDIPHYKQKLSRQAGKRPQTAWGSNKIMYYNVDGDGNADNSDNVEEDEDEDGDVDDDDDSHLTRPHITTRTQKALTSCDKIGNDKIDIKFPQNNL